MILNIQAEINQNREKTASVRSNGDALKEGRNPNRPTGCSSKAQNFWKYIKEKREKPENCSRCGRFNDRKEKHSKGRRGVCSFCLEKLAEWRAKDRIKRKGRIIEQAGLVAEKIFDLEKRIVFLENYKARMQRYAEGRYLQGYRKGKAREKFIQQESRDAWEEMYGQRGDMIGCKLGFEEAKQMNHAAEREI